MEDYLQTEFPELRVWLTSITEQWAVIAVQGPLARQVIAPLITDIDIAAEAMPHMSVREGRVCDVPARLFRVSFTGELGYEINVPADYGPAVWEAVHAAGAAARHHALRHRGDARAARREGLHHRRSGNRRHGDPRRSRPRLDDRQDEARFRRQALADAARHAAARIASSWSDCSRPRCWRKARSLSRIATAPLPMAMLGHVTSAYWSETLRRPIALALLSAGRARIGQTLYVPMADRTIAVRVTEPVFYDPEGQPPACLSGRIRLQHPPPHRRGAPRCSWRACRRRARSDHPRRCRCSASMGLALPGHRAAPHDRADRALLWLGPDEFLLLASDEIVPASDRRQPMRRRVASRHRTDGVRPARRLGDQRVLRARPAARGISGRHVHAHRVRQGRDRAVADRGGDVPASKWRVRSRPMSGPASRRRGASSSPEEERCHCRDSKGPEDSTTSFELHFRGVPA